MHGRWRATMATSLLLLTSCGGEDEPTGCADAGALFQSDRQFTASATDQRNVFVGDTGGRLWRIRLADGDARTIATTPNEWIYNTVLDGETLYFTASRIAEQRPGGTGRVLSVSKDGGQVRELARGLDDFAALKYDATHLYWTTIGTAPTDGPLRPDGKLQRMPKAGGAVETLAANLSAPSDLELDGALVWVSAGGRTTPPGQGGILRVLKTGGAVVHASTANTANSLAVDGGFVYFTSAEDNGSLRRVSKSDAAVESVFLTDLPSPATITLLNDRLFFVPDLDGSSSIQTLAPTGGAPTTVESGLNAPVHIISTPCGPVASLDREVRVLPRSS